MNGLSSHGSGFMENANGYIDIGNNTVAGAEGSNRSDKVITQGGLDGIDLKRTP